jgi:hypothetical protein
MRLDSIWRAQLVAQAADGDFLFIVNRGNHGRQLRTQYVEGGAIALAGVNGQVNAYGAQQRRSVGATGDHHLVGMKLLRFSRTILATIPRGYCANSY